MEVQPAFLVKTQQELEIQLNRLLPFFTHFQIDIVDGEFVPQKTASIDDLAEILAQTSAQSPQITFGFDLIVKDFSAEIHKLESLSERVNISNIFVHNSIFDSSFQSSLPIGRALAPDENVETIQQKFDLNSLPLIQVMSVHPGAQGQPFLPETLTKIEQLRSAGYRNKIYLDGGINDKTLPVILAQQFKPDILCVGSFLTHQEDPQEHIKLLSSALD